MKVYALVDPRTVEVRYVGQTRRDPWRRLQRHLSPCYLNGRTHKERWIRGLLLLGLRPRLVVLESCASQAELDAAERSHIERLRRAGVRLTNLAPGGSGGGSGPHTEESKEKIRRALTGKPKSEEHRQRAGRASLGRKASADTRAKMSELRKGKPTGIPPRRGADNNKTKLTPEAVDEIRALRGVISQRELGLRFGVSKTAIRLVQKGVNHAVRIRQFPEAL